MCKLTAPQIESDIKPIKKTNITLADFLELLDGIIEMPGRMIILTSNHPEILDPALVRPGCIDMIIEFKRLSKQNIKDMYNLWFKTDIPDYIYNNMKDHMFTQAEIGNMFAKRNMDYIHMNLSK